MFKGGEQSVDLGMFETEAPGTKKPISGPHLSDPLMMKMENFASPGHSLYFLKQTADNKSCSSPGPPILQHKKATGARESYNYVFSVVKYLACE